MLCVAKAMRYSRQYAILWASGYMRFIDMTIFEEFVRLTFWCVDANGIYGEIHWIYMAYLECLRCCNPVHF